MEGAYIDGLYYCPHHPHKGYEGEIPELKIDCNCRKPKPGMLLQAAEDFHIDLDRSRMIGDGENDVLAGKNAGCRTALIQTDADVACEADVKVENLLEFVDMVLLRGYKIYLNIINRDIFCGEEWQELIEGALSYCIINGAIMNLEEIQNMGCQEFGLRSKLNMPLKLYKYFPNSVKDENGNKINYSIQALKNNTVFMQSPSEFDDVYDSDISMDFFEYERLRLIEYCCRCEIETREEDSTQEIGDRLLQTLVLSFNSTGSFNSAFMKKPDSEIEQLSNESFGLKLLLEYNKINDIGQALANVIRFNYEEYAKKLKTIFRTSCFTTEPYSQLMWGGAYADCHRGFCVEYTVLPNDKNYEEVYQNLFPVIYCKTRPDMTKRLVNMQDKEFTEESLWDIYSHGALRKSIDWAFQNEWRLLLPMRCENEFDYNVKVFPITKVYLGNRMSSEKRREIIEICHSRDIPYVGVTRNPNKFEMQDCSIKCEDCYRYNGNSTKGDQQK
jgi:hypothetical protein